MRVLVLGLILFARVAVAQPTRDSVLTVSATRVVRLVPDHATLFVTVEGTAETSADALARADGKLVQVLAALRALGDGVRIATPIAFSVAPTPNSRGFPGAPVAATITARTAVRVTVMRMTLLARTFAAASDAGAASAGSLTFESTAADSARLAEVAAAIVSARDEAMAMATGLGGRLGGLVEISSSSMDRGYGQPATLPFEGGMSFPPLAPEVMFHVTVTARFRLVR